MTCTKDMNEPCRPYKLMPLNSEEGYCAAITYDDYYYFSDHGCYESMSPLCELKNYRIGRSEENAAVASSISSSLSPTQDNDLLKYFGE